MLSNLHEEKLKRGVSIEAMAQTIGTSSENVFRKIAELVPFTRDEMFALRDECFPGTSLDYLFVSDGNVPSERERLHTQAESLREVIDMSDDDMAQIHKRLDAELDDKRRTVGA